MVNSAQASSRSFSQRREGSFDVIKYIKHRRNRACRRRKRRRAVSSLNLVGRSTILGGGDVSADDDSTDTPVPKSRCPTYKFSRLDSSLGLQRIVPSTSTWYFLYVGNELLKHDVTLQLQFRNRFRMTFNSYSELLLMCKGSDIFSAWRKKKWNTRGSLIELLLLGSLRYLGRGWTFDDIEESTAISVDTHRSSSIPSLLP